MPHKLLNDLLQIFCAIKVSKNSHILASNLNMSVYIVIYNLPHIQRLLFHLKRSLVVQNND